LAKIKPQFVVLSWCWNLDFQERGIPSQAAWDAHLAEYFGVLNEFKPKVLFLQDVPYRRASVPDLVAGNPGTCAEPRATLSYREFYERWRGLIFHAAYKYAMFIMWAAFLQFCCLIIHDYF
jgi:hypothetical protein